MAVSKKAAPTRSGKAHEKAAPTAKQKKQHAATQQKVRRLSRAFVASADLKPMARQLLESRSPAAYAGVEGYARKHTGSDAGSLAWLAVGYARWEDKEYTKAIQALKLALPHAGELKDYAEYYLASSYVGTGDTVSVLAALRDFDSRFPESLFIRDAMLCYGSTLLGAGHAAEASRVLEKYRTPTRPDVELALGRAYRRAGEPAKAAEALRHVYYGYPLSSEADLAAKELDQLANESALPPLSFAERKARADLLSQMNHSAEAAREFRALLNEAPAASRAGIQIEIGVALHRSGNDREARSILQNAPETGDESSARRWFALAEMARSSNDEARFLEALSHLRQSGPSSESLEQGLLLGGNMYLLQKNYDNAIDFYRELHERFPKGKRAAYSHWKAAWLTFRQGRKADAKKAFEQQVISYPNSPEVSAAMYWRARLFEEDGDPGSARLWYQKLASRFRQYYYAELARTRLMTLPHGEGGHDAILNGMPAAPASAAADWAVAEPPGDSVRYRKSLVLQNGGLTDLAVKELRAAAPEGTGWAMLQIARYYQEQGLYHRSMQTLKRAVPSYFSLEMDALPRPCWEGLFPRPFWSDLSKYSLQNDLDPYLVASLIRQESEFNPGAVSHADAYGLMQLLPVTGRKVARELQMKRFSTGQLLTPTFNLQLGTRYFRGLVNQFGGRLEYALAAYNAGPERVQTWLAEGNYRDTEEFVESIPFTETREYVQAIVRNSSIYKRLYSSVR